VFVAEMQDARPVVEGPGPPGGYLELGIRRCPNAVCNAYVFVVRRGGQVEASYPPERLDFDATDLPPAVLEAFEEAVTCHANQCYTAAGIMVRRTLEEVCADRGANGSTLKDRLQNLGQSVILPKELLDGLDELRLVGNDAAHIVTKHFVVGKDEVEAAVAVTKLVLQALYQYASAVAKLQALKQP
jgi:hypothetical protein